MQNISEVLKPKKKHSLQEKTEKRAGDQKRNIRYRGKCLSRGYMVIHKPTHPNCTQRGYVSEHRLIVEKHIGRYLTKKEQVHHKNGNKLDNKIGNLVLCKTGKDHQLLHWEKYKKINGKWFKFCSECKKYLAVNKRNFYISSCVSVRCKKHFHYFGNRVRKTRDENLTYRVKEKDKLEIIKRFKNGESMYSIARLLGFSWDSVKRCIKNNKRYRRL